MIKIFKKGHKTLTSDIETWVVRWNKPIGLMDVVKYEETARFFTSKKEAKEFAKSLNRALTLLNYSYSPLSKIKCEKVNNKGVY